MCVSSYSSIHCSIYVRIACVCARTTTTTTTTATTYVSSSSYYYYYICVLMCVRMACVCARTTTILLLQMCAHPATIYVSSYQPGVTAYQSYAHTYTHMRWTTIYCICVLILLLYTCPHTTIFVSRLCRHIHTHAMYDYIPHMCAHPATIYVSSYCYICVLMLLYMCPHTTAYVCSSCYCICVLIPAAAVRRQSCNALLVAVHIYMYLYIIYICGVCQRQLCDASCIYIYVYIYNIYVWCFSAAAVRRQQQRDVC
jgi:hypothetical protein